VSTLRIARCLPLRHVQSFLSAWYYRKIDPVAFASKQNMSLPEAVQVIISAHAGYDEDAAKKVKEFHQERVDAKKAKKEQTPQGIQMAKDAAKKVKD